MVALPNSREPKYVRKPTHEDGFEEMCAIIYSVLYNDPGARRNGRRGGRQFGRDVFVTDWSRRHAGQVGKVWIQCKHTTRDDPDIASVRESILDAANHSRSALGRSGAYLFIVATSAPNSAKVNSEVERLKANSDLPFDVEVHAWDTLCDHVVRHTELWELYNDDPGDTLAFNARHSATLMARNLQRLTDRRELKQASDLIKRWRQQTTPAYGIADHPPQEAWQSHPVLRAALKEVAKAGKDSWSLVTLLRHESRMHEAKSAGALLDYLLAERVVSNLRAPTVRWLTQGDRPRFDAVLASNAEDILALDGPPDELGCLALMLILDTDETELWDGALEMMGQLLTRTHGTAWHLAARIVHAVVRFFYVMRAGWVKQARVYALGDRVGRNGARIGILDPRLDEPFDHDDGLPVRTALGDPCRRPEANACAVHLAVSGMARWRGVRAEDILPRMHTQCRLHAMFRPSGRTSHWPSTVWSLTTLRVIDFRTLIGLAEQAECASILDTYGFLATQDTFERLLSYRAVLRAYVSGPIQPVQEHQQLLRAVDGLIERCAMVAAGVSTQRGQISIMPLYDDPPPVLIECEKFPEFGIRRPTKFTVTPEAANATIDTYRTWGPFSTQYGKVLDRYRQRDDEFIAGCLLALDTGTPLITDDHLGHVIARSMGIGAEHPLFPGKG